MHFLYFLPLAVVEENLAGPEVPVVDGGMATFQTVPDLLMGSLNIFGGSIVVPAVLWMLILLSVGTWGIVITKWREIAMAKGQTDKFASIFWRTKNFAQISAACTNLKASPVATVYALAHGELQKILETRDTRTVSHGEFGDIENIERAIKRAKAEELTRLERGTTFLATVASAAPFIGLFGTVWGIMRAFMGLSQAKSTSIQAVAPGISEALIATAVGLAAAIPAAMAYNYFNMQVRHLTREMDKFSAEFLNIAKRHFL